MTEFAYIQPYLNTLGLVLLHSIWQCALIAVGLFLALRIARHASANVRYALSIGALGLALAAPIGTFGFLYPSLTAVKPVDESALIQQQVPNGAPMLTREKRVAPTLIATGVGEAGRNAGLSDHWNRDSLLLGITLVWIVGELFLGIRFAGGLVFARRLRTTGRPVEAFCHERLARLSQSLHIARTVRFFESTLVDVPMVVGWIRPVVLVPTSAILGLSTQQLEAVIAHELAHIRRNDYLVNLLQSVAELLLFYHPGVRWISGQVRNEREHVCDDIAVSSCGDPLLYARALTKLERLRSYDPQLALSATGGDLKTRVLRLVKQEREIQPGAGPLLALVTVAVVLLVACAPSVLSRQKSAVEPEAVTTPSITTLEPIDVQQLNPMVADLVAKDAIGDEDPEVRAAVLSALGEHAGTVVVMDAKTGRLYSVVNQEWALKRGWVPASLMKVISSMAALDQGLLDPSEKIKSDSSSERMDFLEALARSNNQYFRAVAERVGTERFLEYAAKLGLGQLTDVNYIGESAGELPTSSEVRSSGRIGAYGEGVKATPLQLATMFAAIGNGGDLLTPQANRSDAIAPRVRRTIAIPSTTLIALQAAMVETVERGTGTGAHVEGFSIAGKTGSTDAKDNSTGLFASYSPAHDPRIVVMVITQGRKENGPAAATIAGAIYKAIGKRFQLDC